MRFSVFVLLLSLYYFFGCSIKANPYFDDNDDYDEEDDEYDYDFHEGRKNHGHVQSDLVFFLINVHIQ